MNNNEIIIKLQEIVMPFLKEGKILTIEDELVNDLGFDSIDVVDLIVHIEDVFKIQFTEDELDTLKKVSDIVKIIRLKSNETSN